VSWDSVDGETYLILVHGYGGETGDFDLSVTVLGGSVPPIPPIGGGDNDLCVDAVDVNTSPGSTVVVQGSTATATLDDTFSDCGTSITSPGVWYRVSGNGGSFTAGTCGGASWDTKLSVYSGTCGSNQCVVGVDDSCGLQQEVSWDSVDGETYMILVHGFGGETGDFDLSVTVQGGSVPPTNPNCVDTNDTFYVNAALGNRNCDWLSGEMDPSRFGYLCEFVDVALKCPVLCEICAYLN